MKNVLVISTSLRDMSNSERLADAFIEGIKAAHHIVEKVTLKEKAISFCKGCLACQKTQKCVIKDDAAAIVEKMKNADVVVTGEGRLDAQTVMGKAPVGVAALAKKYNAKVIAFAGSVAPEASVCNQAGIDAFFPIVRGVTTLEEAMKKENAMENIAATAEQVFRLL